ncbi:MAG: DUF6783 domain-containing protein [Ruminococcus sp.]
MEGGVAGYDDRKKAKSPAKWACRLAGMIFQTRSRVCLKYYSRNLPQSVIHILQKAFSNTLEFRTYAIFHQKGGWKMATPFTVYKLIILYMLRILRPPSLIQKFQNLFWTTSTQIISICNRPFPSLRKQS